MAVTFTDPEYGDIAEALEWPRQRIYRHPYVPTGFGPAQPFVLDVRLALLDEPTKARALADARAILAAKKAAREDLLSGTPEVSKTCGITMDARAGYESRKRVIDDMRADLARMIDFVVNPHYVSAGQHRVIG